MRTRFRMLCIVVTSLLTTNDGDSFVPTPAAVWAQKRLFPKVQESSVQLCLTIQRVNVREKFSRIAIITRCAESRSFVECNTS